nr:PREDICTED: uncharacterized protein LOC105663777 [Megachile rotundata]
MDNFLSNTPEILHFEKKFCEIIYEIQRCRRELDKLEKDHLLVREELCSKDALLQNERKTSNELRIRLKSAAETISSLEEEKMRDKIYYSNLSMNHDSLLKERDILSKEILSSQTEAAKSKIKIESLENTLQREIHRKEVLEKALIELKNDNEKIIAGIDINITKLSKEQKYLTESAKVVIQLNKRLQTFGLCFHAIHEKNRNEIKDLQHKLAAFSMNDSMQSANHTKLHPELDNLCFKLKDTLMELKSRMQDSVTFEEKLNKFFEEFFCRYNNEY